MDRIAHDSKYFIYWIAIIGALGGLLFGFDTGVIAGALPFINHDFRLTIFMQESLVSSLILGAMLSAIVSGRLADYFGRRRMLINTALTFIIGTAITTFASSFTQLLIGRLLVGTAIGIASYTTPLFISEMAPTNRRGAMVLLNAITITGGQTLAFLSDYWLTPSHNWRMMYALGLLPAALLLIGMLRLPETPRWLMLQGHTAAARALLQRLRSPVQAEIELDNIQQTLTLKRAQWQQLFSKQLQPVLLIGVGLGIFQQFFGINTILYYGPLLFQQIGFHDTTAQILITLGMGVVNTVMSVITLLFVDRLGRRTLLLCGSMLAAFSLAIFGIAVKSHTSLFPQWVAILCMVTFIAGYCISVGSLFWLIIAEIYPLKVRGFAMSLATAVQWGANFLVSMTFLSVLNVLGPAHTFWLYGGFCTLCWFFVYYWVPETKGVSLEQIEQNLACNIPMRELGKPLYQSKMTGA
jgi:MFS transporter, SP family, galactose:H+ symporter